MVSTRQSTLNRNFSGGGFARVVALVATLGLAVACGDSTEKESTYIERGKALYEEGNHVKARLEFKNALQINPKGIDARYYTALIDEREGQWQKAFANFKLVAEQQPDHLQAQLKVGQFYLAAKQMDKAEEQGEIVKKLSPEDPGVIVFLATLDLRNDKLEEAKSGAEAALAKAPDNVAGRILLVRALQRLGKIDDAISEIDILLKSEPDSAAFLLMKAGMLQEKETWTRSRRSIGDWWKSNRRTSAIGRRWPISMRDKIVSTNPKPSCARRSPTAQAAPRRNSR